MRGRLVAHHLENPSVEHSGLEAAAKKPEIRIRYIMEYLSAMFHFTYQVAKSTT
jgi:hypothetical protein